MNMRGLLAARLSDRSLSLIDLHRLRYRIKLLLKINGAQGRIRTSVALSAADLQSAAINHSATCASSARRPLTSLARMERSRADRAELALLELTEGFEPPTL